VVTNLGVVGVGHMTGAMVEGWARLPEGARPRFLLSPRGAKVAARLADTCGAEIMDKNETVVRDSDVVLLGVRPGQVEEAYKGLPWREGQLAISVIAGVGMEALSALVAPARVVRCMPVTACVFAESPVGLFPPDGEAEALLAPLGSVSVVEEESVFDRLAVHGCTYGWLIALVDEIAKWSEEVGLPPEVARRHVAQTFRAAGTTALEDGTRSVQDIYEEIASPGSFTLKGLETLRDGRAFDPWRAALERIRKEYEG
jgi:pyrroline-5-carboxylate reductase